MCEIIKVMIFRKFFIIVISGVLFFLASGVEAQSNVVGSLSFSPETIKNNENFTITITADKIKRVSHLWVDNGDGYIDFGGWISVGPTSTVLERRLNCSEYSTIQPGQSLPVGNRVLTQKIYLEYEDGTRSPEGIHTKDCRQTSSTPTPPPPPPVSTPPPSGPSCNLFPHSTSYIPENLPPLPITPGLSSLHHVFPVNSNIESGNYSYDWAYGAIEEYFQTSNVTVTALDPLPPGIKIGSRTVLYPETNITADGLNISEYIERDRKQGYPPLTRYRFEGFPTQQGQTKVRLQAKSATCTEIQTFTIEVTSPVPPTVPYQTPGVPPASSSTNGIIKFVKTLFYNGPAPGGAQAIRNVRTWGKNGDKFVFVGEYGGQIAGLPLNTVARQPGGGLITVQEDGSKMVERDAAIDAGSGSNQIYQHGHRHASYEIYYEWGSGGFLIENGSWASCLVSISWSDYCPEYGPGANRPVYYRAGTDGFPVPSGKSPPESQGQLIGLKNRVILRGGSLFSLPRWIDEGPPDPGLTGFGFGDFVVNPDGKLYSVDDSGVGEEVMNLLDSGYTSFMYAFDHSVYPPKLAIWEKPTLPPEYQYLPTVDGVKYIVDRAKIKIFRLSGDRVVFEKYVTPPSYAGGLSQGIPYHFAIWGDYLLLPNSQYNGLDLWIGGKKADSVMLPTGIITFTPIAISKKGYVAVVPSLTAREATAFLYKLNLTLPVSTSPPPGITPPGTSPPSGTVPPGTDLGTGGECAKKYPTNTNLRTICEQIEALKAQACKQSPTLSFCAKP